MSSTTAHAVKESVVALEFKLTKSNLRILKREISWRHRRRSEATRVYRSLRIKLLRPDEWYRWHQAGSKLNCLAELEKTKVRYLAYCCEGGWTI